MLGFTCLANEPDWGWPRVELDDIYMMISTPNDHLPFEKPTFTGSFYIDTESINEIWNELKAKTKICYPIADFEYGMRAFAIYDNNGYILQFGQEVS